MYKAISTKDPKSDIRSNIPEAFSTARLNIDTTPLMLSSSHGLPALREIGSAYTTYTIYFSLCTVKFDGPGACPPRRIAKKLQPPRHEPEKTKRRGTAAKAAVPFFSAEAHSLHKDPSRSKPAVGNMHDRQGRRRAGVLGADAPPAMESYSSRRQVSPSTTTAKQPDITVANSVIPGRCASETDSPGASGILGTARSCRGSRTTPATKTSSGLIPLSPSLFRRPRRIG